MSGSREGIDKDLITVITNSSIRTAEPPASFNVTTMDQAWNSPGTRYQFYGYDSVTVSAGTYENCSVYYAIRSVVTDNETLNMSVAYYMHLSSPVPVLYVVRMDNAAIVYELDSVYGPGDMASTPERTVQSYFDRLGDGNYQKASNLMLEPSGPVLRPMNKTEIAGMEAAVANWHSVQFAPLSGQVYYINGTFDMVNDSGNWKIVA